MCILCSETLKGKIIPKEIARAFWEQEMTQEHLNEFAEIMRNLGILDDFIDEFFKLKKELNTP